MKRRRNVRRRNGTAPSCPAPNRRRRVGGAETAAPKCPSPGFYSPKQCFLFFVTFKRSSFSHNSNNFVGRKLRIGIYNAIRNVNILELKNKFETKCFSVPTQMPQHDKIIKPFRLNGCKNLRKVAGVPDQIIQ